MKLLNCITAVILVPFMLAGAETVTDEEIGYSCYLPDHWVKSEVSTTQHLFEDTSGTYLSMIAIIKYDFSEDTVFSSANEWTRANFIAYAFSVDADPLSIIVFYDTVTAKQNETLWAADAFSQFFSIDTTIGDWAEYIRYTASGTNGYEIYAIGPIEDMEANIGFYLAVIEGITIEEEVAIVSRPKNIVHTTVVTSVNRTAVFDLLGRNVQPSLSLNSASRMVLYRDRAGMRRKLTFR